MYGPLKMNDKNNATTTSVLLHPTAIDNGAIGNSKEYFPVAAWREQMSGQFQ